MSLQLRKAGASKAFTFPAIATRVDYVVPGDRLKLSAIDDAAPSRAPISPRYLYLRTYLYIYRRRHTDVLSAPVRRLRTPSQSLQTRGVAWGHNRNSASHKRVAKKCTHPAKSWIPST